MNMNISIILPFFRPQIYNFLMIYPNKCGNFVDNMFFLTAEKLIIQLTDEYWRVGASARQRVIWICELWCMCTYLYFKLLYIIIYNNYI